MAGSGRCSLAAVPVSGCCVLFPSRYFAGAVLACVRLSSCVSSVSPVVAAVGLAVAASQRLAALALRCARCLDHNQRQPNEVSLSSAGGEERRASTNHQLHQRQQTEPSRSSRSAKANTADDTGKQEINPAGQASRVPALLSLMTPSAKSWQATAELATLGRPPKANNA